jgi:GAF domain-containing protein
VSIDRFEPNGQTDWVSDRHRKRRKRPSAVAGQRTSAADLQKQLDQRTRELAKAQKIAAEALQQQTATAQVLKIISRSTFDLQAVLQTLVESAALLCEADLANIWLPRGKSYHLAASFGIPGKDKEWQANKEYLESIGIEPGRGSIVGRALLEKKPAQIYDVQADPDYLLSGIVSIGDYRTLLGVPLLREGEPIGVIGLTRCMVQPFTDKQIELVSTFADQAVIAIENARLFDEVQAKTHELSEALAHQTGSANILSVIASSPTDVGPVLNAIVESASELCEANDAVVALREDDNLVFKAQHGSIPTLWTRLPINPQNVSGRAVIDGKPVHVRDLCGPDGDEFPDAREFASRTNVRTVLGVPLLRDNEAIGAIVLRRTAVQPFSDKQITLLRTFADQAVIAIQNVQLFKQVQERTRELTKSLEQQTATAEVLQIISSSPGELQPVFQVMLANATRLCQASYGVMWLREGDAFRSAAVHGPLPLAYVDQWRSGTLYHPTPHSPLALVTQTRKPVQVPDMRENRSYLDGDPLPVAAVEVAGVRTLLGVPMVKEDDLAGAIAIYRQEVRTFTEKQVDLVSNFAQQAVIAIENTRLLNELRQSLQQQTATADVLKTISRSSTDLETVLDTLVETVARLCRADQAYMFRRQDEASHMLAARGLTEEVKDFILTHPLAVDRGTINGRVMLERRAVHVPDVLQDPEFTYWEGQKVAGYRTVLGVPLLRGDELIGVRH